MLFMDRWTRLVFGEKSGSEMFKLHLLKSARFVRLPNVPFEVIKSRSPDYMFAEAGTKQYDTKKLNGHFIMNADKRRMKLHWNSIHSFSKENVLISPGQDLHVLMFCFITSAGDDQYSRLL